MERRIARCTDPYLRCAFYGACQTAFGVETVCVIAHAPQGCQLSADVAFRWQQADRAVTERLCTKLCEDEIVHGGEPMLRRTVEEARRMNVPLCFIISACGPEIVGDNIQSVAEEMEGDDFQIIPVRAPGFLGNQYKGADIALKALIERIPDNERGENTVCILAPHASANPTWQGDLRWVRDVLSLMGARVTSVLTHGSSPEDLKTMGEACLVLSHDAGLEAAHSLQERGVEHVCKDIPLPIGMENTRQFLLTLGERFDHERTAEAIIEKGEKNVIQTLRRRGLEVEFFHKASTAVVADGTVGIPLLRFLTEDLEMIPELVLLRSDTSKLLAEREIHELGIGPAFRCGIDVYQVKELLKETSPTCIVGSNIETHLAVELGIPLSFEVVAPVLEYRMVDRVYFAYEGILTLIENMQNQGWNRWKSRKKRYLSRW